LEFGFGAGDEVADFGGGIGVFEAEHGDAVGDLGKAIERGTADAAGGGIGGAEFRMLGFEIDQFPVETVVDDVGNGGARLDVIGVVMGADLLGEIGVALCGGIVLHPLGWNGTACGIAGSRSKWGFGRLVSRHLAVTWASEGG